MIFRYTRTRERCTHTFAQVWPIPCVTHADTHTRSPVVRFLCRSSLCYNVYSFRNIILRYFACSARFRLFVLQARKTSSAITIARTGGSVDLHSSSWCLPVAWTINWQFSKRSRDARSIDRSFGREGIGLHASKHLGSISQRLRSANRVGIECNRIL